VVERTFRSDFKNSPLVDYWRSLGWKLTDASPLVAAMLAWARLVPETIETSEFQAFGFFDNEKEVTTQSWRAIVGAMRNMRSERGDFWAFDDLEAVASRTAPGTIESLRQAIDASISNVNDNEPRSDRLQQLARQWIQIATEENSNLTDLMVRALNAKPNESIYCAFDLSASIALELAKQHHVYLELPNLELARLVALLSIAGGYLTDIACSDPIPNGRVDAEVWPDRRTGRVKLFDHAVALPPFGIKYSGAELKTKIGSANTTEGLNISLVLGHGTKRQMVVVPDGFLFRTAKNDQVNKRHLISAFGLTSVISLPRGILGRESGVFSSLLIFDAGNISPDQNIRFIDCRSDWPSKTRLLSPQAAERQLRAWLARINSSADNEHVSSVKLEELADNDFNLLVDRYVVDPEIRRQRQFLEKQRTFSLDDLAELHRPQVFKPTPEDLRPPVGQIITMREVSTSDIRDGSVERPEKEIDIWAGDVDQIERVILRPGDILISVKGKAGVAGVVPEDAPEDIFGAWTAGQPFVIARLRRSTAISSPVVLARYLASPFGQAQLQALAGGTTVPFIQMADLRRLAIPVPPVEAQRKIVQQIEEIKKRRQQIQKIETDILERERSLSKLFFSSVEK
jgi:type I restriction enzyme M protein